MERITPTQRRVGRLPAVAALIALTLAVTGGHAPAQEAQHTSTSPGSPAGMKVTDLEDTFWICDWSATVGRLGAAQATACASATEELKSRKFGGDLDRLIEWWQKNKTAVYERLNTTYVEQPR